MSLSGSFLFASLSLLDSAVPRVNPTRSSSGSSSSDSVAIVKRPTSTSWPSEPPTTPASPTFTAWPVTLLRTVFRDGHFNGSISEFLEWDSELVINQSDVQKGKVTSACLANPSSIASLSPNSTNATGFC